MSDTSSNMTLEHPFLRGLSELLDQRSSAGHEDIVKGLLDAELPTRRHEEWRFVKLNALRDTEFTLADGAQLTAAQRDEITATVCPEANGSRVVFVDGVLSADLSDLTADTAGVSVEVVEAGASGFGEVAALVQGGEDFFVKLSDAAWRRGVKIAVEKNTSGPVVEIVYVSTAQSSTLDMPRVAIEVGAGSKVGVVERYISLGDAACFDNCVVEATLGTNARLDHVKHQESNQASFHVARMAVRLNDGAHLASVTVHQGAKLSRTDLHGEIAGTNTTCELHGLAFIGGAQVSDTHSVMNHVSPHAVSDQVHKCVVDGKGHAVFNGKIFVQQDAQQINAFQLNRNLLLTPTAKIDTKPQLEIFADDVKCSHGATIGQLDEDQLFYLRSRGLGNEQARSLLTYAFAGELVDRIPVESLQQRIARDLMTRTQGSSL